MPRSLFGFVWQVSAWSQLWISLLAIGVFILSTVPLELQRRALNATVLNGDIKLIFGLLVAYACVVMSEGLVKLLMNVYRGWAVEKAVRALRLATSALVDSMPEQRGKAGIQGVEISLILAEPEPIGAFVGISVSELVLQIGILLSVFGYMFYIQPLMAVVSLAVFSPQFVFVPLMQRAINRRAQSRIAILREATVGVLQAGTGDVERALAQDLRFAEIFQLNLGIVKLKYSMNFLMNLTQNFGKVIVLGVGGWYVINGETEVGTVVAFLLGLHNLNDPWGDLVNWFQDMMVNNAKYRIFVSAMDSFARGESAPVTRIAVAALAEPATPNSTLRSPPQTTNPAGAGPV
jgi:ABC-type bacteriocin/lantibiotic exporter with double-glycine peptidase domain